jgi:hypothetical protein
MGRDDHLSGGPVLTSADQILEFWRYIHQGFHLFGFKEVLIQVEQRTGGVFQHAQHSLVKLLRGGALSPHNPLIQADSTHQWGLALVGHFGGQPFSQAVADAGGKHASQEQPEAYSPTAVEESLHIHEQSVLIL